MFRVTWIFLPFCSAVVLAQQHTGGEAGLSTVSGFVYFADTNAPARLATVVLEPAKAVDSYRADVFPTGIATTAEGVQTLLDGSYTFRRVKPGDYYVLASAPGYLSPLEGLARVGVEQPSEVNTQTSGRTESARRQILHAAPRVTVQAGLPAMINVTLERGGAVSGTVHFDDGSPASGVIVQPLIHRKEGWSPLPGDSFGGLVSFGQTDDQGHYRLTGLPEEDYILEVDLQIKDSTYSSDGTGGSATSSSSGYSLPFYSGSHARKKDALPFKLKPGEERHDEDIEIPLGKLHAVHGIVTAARDGHPINGGSAVLLNAEDRSTVNQSYTSIEEDGFHFGFVPEGDYLLEVDGADTETKEFANPPNTSPAVRKEVRVLRYYAPSEIKIHVDGDVSGLVVPVAERAPDAASSANH